MTFTYSFADLTSGSGTQTRTRVRFTLGDTNPDDFVLDDEELDYILTLSAAVNTASVKACKHAIARIKQDIDSNGAGISVNRSQKIQHFETVLTMLEKDLLGTVSPFLAGASKSERTDLLDNSDWPGVSFEIGQDDYPGS